MSSWKSIASEMDHGPRLGKPPSSGRSLHSTHISSHPSATSPSHAGSLSSSRSPLASYSTRNPPAKSSPSSQPSSSQSPRSSSSSVSHQGKKATPRPVVYPLRYPQGGALALDEKPSIVKKSPKSRPRTHSHAEEGTEKDLVAGKAEQSHSSNISNRIAGGISPRLMTVEGRTLSNREHRRSMPPIYRKDDLDKLMNGVVEKERSKEKDRLHLIDSNKNRDKAERERGKERKREEKEEKVATEEKERERTGREIEKENGTKKGKGTEKGGMRK